MIESIYRQELITYVTIAPVSKASLNLLRLGTVNLLCARPWEALIVNGLFLFLDNRFPLYCLSSLTSPVSRHEL
jgi:hypothetical protein